MCDRGSADASEAVQPTAYLEPSIDLKDTDEDGVVDSADNCPEAVNSGQEDADLDGVGDACEPEADADEDGVVDELDKLPQSTRTRYRRISTKIASAMSARKRNRQHSPWRPPLALAAVAAVLGLIPGAAEAAGGVLDPTFGEGGVSLVKPPRGYTGEAAYALTTDRRGRIVVAGETESEAILVRRYLHSGSPDPSFGLEGRVETEMGTEVAARAVVTLPGGDVLAAGGTETGLALVRYHEDGTLAKWFGKNGHVIVPGGTNGASALTLGIQPRGRILSGGYKIDLPGDWTGLVVGSKPNGMIDHGFAGDGFAELHSSPVTKVRISGLKVLGDGKVLVGGDVGGRLFLGRLRANGTPDPSFGGGDGIVLHDADGAPRCPCSFARAMTVDREGRPILAGVATGIHGRFALLARFRPDGRLDRSFGHHGVVRTHRGSEIELKGLTVGTNGRITVTGFYEPKGPGVPQVAVLRYLSNGKLDQGFAHHGFFHRRIGLESVGWAAITQPDGRVVVDGRATIGEPVVSEAPVPLQNSRTLLMRFRR